MSFYAAMAKAASRLVEQYGMEARWYSQESAVSPSCSVTLTGDAAAAIGGTAMSISGQTASYTLGAPTVWVASDPVVRSKPTSGAIIAEVIVSGTSEAAPLAVISDATLQYRVFVGRNRLTGGFLIAVISGGTPVFVDETSAPGDYAIGVSSDGDPLIFIDGSPVNLGGAGAGMFTSRDFTLAAVDQDMQNSGSGSVEFVTNGADFAQTYPSGTLDWCGNSIGSGGFDPVTGKNSGVTDVPHLVQSVFVETDVSLVDGSRIESGRKVILMDGAQTPMTGWKLDADYTDGVPAAGSFPGAVSGGVRGRWTVVKVKEINPAGIPLLYELQVMQ